MPLALAAGVLAVLAVSAFGVLQAQQTTPHVQSGLHDAPSRSAAANDALAADPQGILDSDHDGLRDALENYVYGTDPLRTSTGGSGLPDGWLARYGLDTSDPTMGAHPAAVPDGTKLPPAYHGVWPARFVPTLSAVYDVGRPAAWNESAQGPFFNGLDPRVADNNGDGIPDGYLMAFHLDPRDRNVTTAHMAGPAGLEVRVAFEHGTDPTKTDTDGDGIPDREEIEGPTDPTGSGSRFAPTDPTRYDTAGTGVCDGYLRAHGLDPNKPASAYADLAHSGNTTKAKFLWSKARFGDLACSQGKGLDPRAGSTLGLPIPDGWLMRYGLDPLDGNVTGKTVQQPAPDPPSCPRDPSFPAVQQTGLTVLDKYAFGKPADWKESERGPWWGGLDPSRPDSDGDGLADPVEIAGYYLTVSTQVGPTAAAEPPHLAHSDPTRTDTDGDGLTDGEEMCPNLRATNLDRHATDAQRRDTDFDGLADAQEVGLPVRLDPSRADSAGDYLRDGERYRMLTERAAHYLGTLTYEHQDPEGPHGVVRKVTDWLGQLPGVLAVHGPAPLTAAEVAGFVGPLGHLNATVVNALNPDLDQDGLLNGWEVHPELDSSGPPQVRPILDSVRSATDPLNPDTDGDGLQDGWEVQYGLPNALGSGYKLEPLRYDSGSGSCIPPAPVGACGDGEKDFAGDSFTWYTYTGTPPATVRQEPHHEAFSNRLKQQWSQQLKVPLDPNRFSSRGDGLGDGWKVFWGITYPAMQDPSILGAVYPGGPTGPNSASTTLVVPSQAQPEDQPSAQLAEFAYTRFMLVGGSPLPWETPAGIQDVTLPDGAHRSVATLHGTLHVTLQAAQTYGLNPYMVGSAASSDGDTMPDGWEVLQRILKAQSFPGQPGDGCSTTADGPDPALPDAAAPAPVRPGAPESSTFAQKWQAATSALCYDSDLGGVDDAREATLLQSPMDPRDDTAHLGSQDSDGDGVPDYEEVAGAGHTDPGSPDTDGDGLLDGGDVPAQADAGLAPTAPLARSLADLGIAFQRLASQQVLCYHDGDGDHALGATETVYLRIGSCGAVAAGDYRLTASGSAPAASIVLPMDSDVGASSTGAGLGAARLAYTDASGDGQPGPGDVVYLQPVASSTATAADILLAGPAPFTRAAAGAPVTGLAATPSDVQLADLDADGVPSAGDGLSLRLLGAASSATTPGDLRLTSAMGHAAGTFVAAGDADASRVAVRFASVLHFLGEGSGDANNAFDAGGGVPSGWLRLYGVPGRGDSVSSCLGFYSLGRPTWWSERVDGPWWGGADPQGNCRNHAAALASLRSNHDLDCDRLLDTHADGSGFEDPFPSNAPDAWRLPSQAALQQAAAASLAPLPPLPLLPMRAQDPATLSPIPLPAVEQRLLAQGLVAPARVSATPFSPAASCSQDTRPQPEIHLDQTQLTLLKGTPTTVSGSVVLAGQPVAGVTLEATMGDPAQAFGAGTTDPQGKFSFPVNLALKQSVPLPATATVLRGAGPGWVNWTTDPAAISAGNGLRLTFQTYATTAAPLFADHSLPVMGRTSTDLSVQVRSRFVVTLASASSQAIAGQPLRVSFHLADSGGSPRQDRISFSPSPDATPPSPDAQGLGDTAFTFTGAAPMVTVTATAPASQDGFIDAGSATLTFNVRHTALLTLDAPAAQADAGSVLGVSGTLKAAGTGVPGATVVLQAGGPTFPTMSAVTDGGGRFQAQLPLANALPAGKATLAASFAGSSSATAASDSRSVQVRSLPAVAQVEASSLDAAGPARVTGMLLEPDGRPIGGAQVHLELGEATANEATLANGSFAHSFPGPLPRHPLVQAITFAGDAGHAPASSRVERPVWSGTHLSIAPGAAARGGTTSVPVRLTAAGGLPVPAAAVTVRWGREPAQSLVTRPDGTAQLVRSGERGEALGTVQVQAWFNGSADGSLQPSTSAALWSVASMAEIDLPSGAFDLGTFVPAASLRDAGTGEPLRHTPVQLSGGRDGSFSTDDLGRFSVVPSLAREATPRVLHVTADYAGDAVYSGVHASSTLALRSPTTLDPHTPAGIVAGQPAPVTVRVEDAAGRLVSDGEVAATLDGVRLGSAPVHDGAATVVATVPSNRTAGTAQLEFSFNGTELEGASTATAAVQVLAPVDLILEATGGRPGATLHVEVRASSGGKALAFAPIVLDVEGQGGQQALTDKDGRASFLVLQPNGTLHMAARFAGQDRLAPAWALASLGAVSQPSLLHAGLQLAPWVAGAVGLALAAAAIVARRLRRHPLEPAFRRARRAFRGRGPYAAQVLEAYGILEDAAIAHEILDRPANTPRGLESALQAVIEPGLHDSLDHLVSVFELARYGASPVGPMHRDAALEALAQLRRGLSRMDDWESSPLATAGTAGRAP